MSSVKVTDNTEETLDALKRAAERGLEIIGGKIVKYATKIAPADTGNLRNSIDKEIDTDELSVTVGSSVTYAPYVELGTGPKFVMPPEWIQFIAEKGRGLPRWVYRDEEGKFHTAYPQPPHPFLRPAIENHTEEYKYIFESELKRG